MDMSAARPGPLAGALPARSSSSEEQRVDTAGVTVVFPPAHATTGAALVDAVEATVAVLGDRWGLRAPSGCEVHVLTDPEVFVRATAPPRWRWLLGITRPLWRPRAERVFALAGGWMQPWRGRPAVGVKPPELLARAETRLGERLFVPVPDPLEKVRHIAVHELTHAFTAHLRLPPWLNEGLAMRAVDHVVGRSTVREDSRELASLDLDALDGRAYRRVRARDHEALIGLYATGYWITRRLEDEAPALLAELLSRRRSHREVARCVAAIPGS
jgi:hypothetical protein